MASVRPSWFDAAVLTLAVLVLYLLSTRHGIGIEPDTTRYMQLVDDPYDAPVYAWLLKAGTLSGASLPQAAYVLALFFICANTLLVWLMLFRATGRRAPAAAGTAITVFSPVFIGEHTVAMSEAPFIFCVLLTVFALLRFWETEKRQWLLWCGIGLGIATLVRFTAPPLGAAFALSLLITGRDPFIRRIKDVGLLAVIGAAILLAWTTASQLVVGRSIGRDLAFYGDISPHDWLSSLNSATSMLLPTQVPLPIRAFVLAAFLVGGGILCIWQGRRALRQAAEPRNGGRMLTVTLGFFFVFYIAFLLLAFWLEANQHFTTRYLLPVFVTTAIMMTILIAEAAKAQGGVAWLRHLLVALAVLVFASHVVRTADHVREDYDQGIGFTSLQWTNSPTVQAARRLPGNSIIYTNGPDALAYQLQRHVFMSPHRVYWRTNLPDPSNPLPVQLARLDADLAKGNTYVVIVDAIDWRHYLVTEAELKRRLGLILIDRETDGRIYGRPASAPRPESPAAR